MSSPESVTDRDDHPGQAESVDVSARAEACGTSARAETGGTSARAESGSTSARAENADAAASPRVRFDVPATIDVPADVVVVGAGACGLVAALRAAARGREVLVLERDASPSGSTSMSSGFVPAPGTRFQRAIGVDDDSAERFLADVQAKSGQRSMADIAALATTTIGPTLEWLADAHGLEWIVLDDFLYPGHTRHRMHAVPERTGAALQARLLAAVEAAGVTVVTGARAADLHADADGRVVAVVVERPDGHAETIGCGALVLACNGYGGNVAVTGRHIPELVGGTYHGHAGNTGDALAWGEALDARTGHLGAYQGHGSLAHPHGILITWALMTEGGVQVDTDGQRFSNESGGYSEQAVHVAARPGGIAWDVYDARLHAFARDGFPDYREAMAAGAVLEAPTLEALAALMRVPPGALVETMRTVEACRCGDAVDPFGRDFTTRKPLAPPWHAVRVTGALFHTQGGLLIDDAARVVRADGSPLPNLHAAGGAACGVSGPDVTGYLSGNGLLTAIALGALAGDNAGG